MGRLLAFLKIFGPGTDVRRTAVTILTFTVSGVLFVILFTSSAQASGRMRLIGIALLYAGAFFAVGALVGLLFGVPRSSQEKSSSSGGGNARTAGTQAPNAAKGNDASDRFRDNTNLEEISDWLTKIIVGLGLANLAKIPDKLRGLARYFAGFCGTDDCESAAMAIVIYFFICGFFLGYLMTRLYLTGAFARVHAVPIEKAPLTVEESDTGTVDAISDVE